MSWQDRFSNVVDLCGKNINDLQSRTCKDGQKSILQNYKNYYREATGDFDAYTDLVSERGMTPGLNLEIENKIRHYNDSCNNLYPMYRKMFEDECGKKQKSISKNLITFGIIGLAIILILTGFFVKDKLLKNILWGIGGLIIILVGVYYIHQIFFAKKKIDFIPYF